MKKIVRVLVFLALAVGYLACGKSYSAPTQPGTAPGPTPTATRY